MRFEVSGDFLKLERFKTQLDTAGGQTVLNTLSEQLAETTIDLIRDGFEHSRDPFGRPWKKLLLRKGGRPLEYTGGMKDSWFRKASNSHGFTVANGKQYAIFHQRGTGLYGPHKQRIKPKTKRALKLPGGILRSSVAGSVPRRMVPTKKLPTSWRDAFIDTSEEVIRELRRGK